MKATGIVRRMDELGRVVIPREIRRTQHIRHGDALEIYTLPGGEVVFKKYSTLGSVEELAGNCAEVLAKSLGLPVVVCDREQVVAAAGAGRTEYLHQPITEELEALLAKRSACLPRDGREQEVRLCPRSTHSVSCVVPVVARGDMEGGVCVLGGAQQAPPPLEQLRAATVAAGLLARWMEE